MIRKVMKVAMILISVSFLPLEINKLYILSFLFIFLFE
jgi:hypothetical protein